jgi:hypothetical protein
MIRLTKYGAVANGAKEQFARRFWRRLGDLTLTFEVLPAVKEPLDVGLWDLSSQRRLSFSTCFAALFGIS